MSQVQENIEQPTHELFGKRWSPRAFDLAKKVSKQDVLSCIEAARWAPSCFGEEPWRFIVCDKEDDAQAWQKLLSCLAPKNQEWAEHAQVLMVACTNTKFSHNGNENGWAEYDAGAASVSLCLQATALGLSTHQMGGFDGEAVRESFAVPVDYKPMAAIALGYQGDVTLLGEDFRAAEQATRQRKPLAEIALYGGW
ncbi:MAG: nitroreductase family protein [Ghiorsea sp.]